MGIPALTAYHAVIVDGGVDGKTVLVAGGAGAVGYYAVQLAKIKGAKQVIATVSNEEKAALAREAGADVVLNYKTDDIVSAIDQVTAGRGVDRIVEVDFAANVNADFAANVNADIAALHPNGEIIIYGSGAAEISVPFSPAIRKGARMAFFIVYSLEADVRERAIADLTRMLREDRLIHNIAARLPLEKIAEAHELVERGGASGNVILQVE